MRDVLVVGHSHVGAIRAAAQARRAIAHPGLRVRTIAVLDPAFGGEFAESADGRRFSPGLAAAIRDQIDRHDPVLVSALGGNMHTVLSLVEEDEPYDFALSGEPSPKLNARAKLLEEDAVRTWLAGAMAPDLKRLTLLRDVAGPFLQLESPPPVAARTFIARRIEPYFRDMPAFARNGVAPGGVRYRMWRLAARVFTAHCATLGCRFLPGPRTVLDESGFLDQRFASDSTHGNEAYGEAVIALLETLSAVRRPATPAAP